jgi:hypothetical protein
MKLAGRQRTVTAGEDVAVPAATAHAWGNTGNEPAHAVVRLTPSYLIEEYFEAFCRIASTGQASKLGLPRNPLQFEVLIDHHRAEFALPSPLAQAVAGPALRALAVAGRAAGFRADGTRARTGRGEAVGPAADTRPGLLPGIDLPPAQVRPYHPGTVRAMPILAVNPEHLPAAPTPIC